MSSGVLSLILRAREKRLKKLIDNLKEAIELYLEDEDAQIPAAGQVFTTMVEVSSHAKTSCPVSS
jgi:hypothetical protein